MRFRCSGHSSVSSSSNGLLCKLGLPVSKMRAVLILLYMYVWRPRLYLIIARVADDYIS